MQDAPDKDLPEHPRGESSDAWNAKVDAWLLAHLRHDTFRRAVFKLTRNQMIDAYLRAGGTRTTWSTNHAIAQRLGTHLASKHSFPDPGIQRSDSPWVDYGHVRHLLEDMKML